MAVSGGADGGGQQRGGEGGGPLGEVHPEFSCQEVVEERIEAAAQTGHAQRQRVELTHGQRGGAVRQDLLRNHQVEQEVDVVRGKAEQEEGRAAQHHPQSPSFLTVGQLFLCPTAGGDGLQSTAGFGV